MILKRHSIVAFFIGAIYIVTVAFFALSLAKETKAGRKAAQERFQSISREISENLDSNDFGSDAFVASFLKSLGDMSDIARLQIKNNDTVIVSYPAGSTSETGIRSSFIRTNSQVVNTKEGMPLVLTMDIYSLKPNVIYYKGRIAFLVILAATLLCLFYLIYVSVFGDRTPKKSLPQEDIDGTDMKSVPMEETAPAEDDADDGAIMETEETAADAPLASEAVPETTEPLPEQSPTATALSDETATEDTAAPLTASPAEHATVQPEEEHGTEAETVPAVMEEQDVPISDSPEATEAAEPQQNADETQEEVLPAAEGESEATETLSVPERISETEAEHAQNTAEEAVVEASPLEENEAAEQDGLDAEPILDEAVETEDAHTVEELDVPDTEAEALPVPEAKDDDSVFDTMDNLADPILEEDDPLSETEPEHDVTQEAMEDVSGAVHSEPLLSADTEEASAEPLIEELPPEPELPPVDPALPQGLYSPKTGFGWEAYMIPRLDNELIRAASTEQDLALFTLSIEGLDWTSPAGKDIAQSILSAASFPDLIFEYGSDGCTAILPGVNIETSLKTADSLYSHIISLLETKQTTLKVGIGISARSLRMISGTRLANESAEALKHALDDNSSPIVAFKVNPEKYRNYLASAASKSS